tara:strand:- start:1411 stop:1593 length:183 start_codon:yes stop_codon:yes gene_type:complete
MKNDSNHQEKKKDAEKHLKMSIERFETPLRDKIEKSPIMTTLKSMKQLADEIEELIGKKK